MAAIFFSAACAVPFVIIAEQRDKAAQQVAHTGPILRRGWASINSSTISLQACLMSQRSRRASKALRYQKLLDEGRHASISDMAAAEKIERGYLGTLLRLTLLAPGLVEAILNGRQPEGVTLPRLLEGVPAVWGEQKAD